MMKMLAIEMKWSYNNFTKFLRCSRQRRTVPQEEKMSAIRAVSYTNQTLPTNSSV